MNKIPCEKCAHYDPQKRIHNGQEQTKSFGRCTATPPSANGGLPLIVIGKQTQTQCTRVQGK